MNPEIYKPKKAQYKKVKNLGWLLKHRRQVAEFRFYHLNHDHWAGYLVAPLNDGPPSERTVFKCWWVSWNICLEWLKRPSWRGLKLYQVFPKDSKSTEVFVTTL